ncbi:MAG: hypothetical protein HXY22_12870 [Alphaproteobacteria bacterium]|nr:hypothetical protein [Alphaproteobacteria bacterium]
MRLSLSLAFVPALLVPLGGCVAVSVATTAVSVTTSAVGTVAEVGVSAAGAAVDLALPTGDCTPKQEDAQPSPARGTEAEAAKSNPADC